MRQTLNGKRRPLAALGMVGAMALAAAAAGDPAESCIKAQRLTGSIVMDGRLDEAAWQAAPPSSDFVWLGLFKQDTPPARTNVKLLYDDDAVYFGVYCAEPLMAQANEIAAAHASDVFSMDSLEVFIAPDGRIPSYYQYVLGINNGKWNRCWGEKGNIIREYNGLWTSATHRGTNYWTAEIRIPLSDFYFTPAASFSDTWLVNVARERKPEQELTTCAPLKKSFFRESDGFLRVKGLPKKPRALDMTVSKAGVALLAKTDKGYEGAVDLEILCGDPEAYGDYTIAILADETNLVRKAVTLSQPVNAFSIDGAALAELKPILLKVVLTARNGKPAGGALFPVVVEYRPLDIVVHEPFYSNCIYPGQDIKTIAGEVRVRLSPAQLKGASLELMLKGSNVEQRLSRSLTNNVVGFSFDATGLTVGEYALSAEVRVAGVTVASGNARIRKLPEGPHVWIDSNLNFVVHGKPMIVRGWYGEGYLLSDALRREPGVLPPDNRLVNFWGRCAGLESERMDPDPAEAQRSKTPVQPSQKVFDAMRATIGTCRTNANCWYYYLNDEPECRLISPVYLKYQYDFIKDLDPSRPVAIITRDPSRYVSCADILNPHDYLSPLVDSAGKRSMLSPKSIRRSMRSIYRDGGHRIAAWATPQAYNCGFINDPDADYPTFDEFNCMIFTALANGCKGFTPYIYYEHFDSLDLRLGCDFIYESIAYLEDILLGPPVSLPVTVSAPDDGVDVMIKQVKGTTLVIAVNLLDRPVRAAVESPVLKDYDRLYGFREQRETRLRDGRMKLKFAPYQVQIMSNPKIGTELKSQEQFMAELNAARAALKKPGNILFGKGRNIEWDSSARGLPNLGLYNLANGVCDAFGWTNLAGTQPPWIEGSFKNFELRFKSAKIYSTTVEDLDFFVWKDGDWKKIGGVKGNHEPVIGLAFPEQVSTAKIRIVMPKSRGNAEVYEIELYE